MDISHKNVKDFEGIVGDVVIPREDFKGIMRCLTYDPPGKSQYGVTDDKLVILQCTYKQDKICEN